MDKLTDEELAQKYLDEGMVQVKDEKTARHFLKRSANTSQETYDNLIRVIAEAGCLYIPFRGLPKVKEILNNDKHEDEPIPL